MSFIPRVSFETAEVYRLSRKGGSAGHNQDDLLAAGLEKRSLLEQFGWVLQVANCVWKSTPIGQLVTTGR